MQLANQMEPGSWLKIRIAVARYRRWTFGSGGHNRQAELIGGLPEGWGGGNRCQRWDGGVCSMAFFIFEFWGAKCRGWSECVLRTEKRVSIVDMRLMSQATWCYTSTTLTASPPLLLYSTPYSLDNTSPLLTTSHPRNVNSSTAEIIHPWKVLNPFHVAEPGPNQFWPETSPSDDPRVLKPPIRGGG